MTIPQPDSQEAPTLTDAFVRASSITLRFSDPVAYKTAVILYCKALGQPFPSPFTDSHSFKISDTLELLCGCQKGYAVTDCTIVYWEVGSTPQEIDNVCGALQVEGFKLLEDRDHSPRGEADKPNTLRAVLEDKTGHRTGVIINPPVPIIGPVKQREEVLMPPFIIEPTHVINPPATVADGGARPE